MAIAEPRKSGLTVAASLHPVRPQWLAQMREDAIDPTAPIIDSHHHLWNLPGSRYQVPAFLEELRAGHNVVGTVYVQSGTAFRTSGPEQGRSVGETEYAASAGEEADRLSGGRPSVCAAIVGPLSLTLGNAARPVLEEHIRAGRGRFRGIRAMTHWDSDPAVHKVDTRPEILSSRLTAEVARLLIEMDLSLDVFCYHTQLPEVIGLAEAFPELHIIVNHSGTPLAIGRYEGMRDDVFQEWRAHLARCRKHENIFLKFGGLGMRYSGFEFDKRERPPSSDELVQAWQPYFDACLDAFSPYRCMFGSNFPVDKTSFSYGVLWNAFKKLCSRLEKDEQARLLNRTASQLYRLSLE